MGEILQLKPKENAFYKMSKSIKGKISIVFICEGKRDTEVLKGVLSKVFENLDENVAITDCEGYDSVKEIAKYIIALSSISRYLKSVPIIVDADNKKPKERAEGISSSIRATYNDVKLVEIDKDIFELQSHNFKVNVFVKVVGNSNLPYKRHMIDDYILHLLILEGLINEEKIENYNTAKECIDDFIESENTTVKELILKSKRDNVQKAFENIIKYLKLVEKSVGV